jgi:hypothetical protein
MIRFLGCARAEKYSGHRDVPMLLKELIMKDVKIYKIMLQ